jgi:hypothetical protein
VVKKLCVLVCDVQFGDNSFSNSNVYISINAKMLQSISSDLAVYL